MHQAALYLGAGILAIWGMAHLGNTRGALNSFEPISIETRRVAAMEWIMEGLTLNFIAVLVVGTSLLAGQEASANVVYRMAALMLSAMAVVSLFTGARVSFWAYKLCPVIFGAAAVLFLIGSL